MNSRERYKAVTHFKSFDRLFRHEMGPYEETLKRWRSEGMPADKNLAEIVGYDTFQVAPVNLSLCPGFSRENIEETEEYVIYRDDRDGAIKKARKDTPPPAMPQYLEFPLRDRETWRKDFLPRLKSENSERLPQNWISLSEQYKTRDYPLGLRAGSFFGWLRDWMGVENIAVAFYDDPSFVKEMMDYLGDLFVEVLKKVVFDVDFDFALMWEDMAYKTASLISPKHFREFMTPNYKKVTDLLHKAGVDIVMLDSDGNVEELIPLWLECGVNYIYPMEVAAGMDVVKLRKEHGKELIIGGGMDKRVLTRDRKAIDEMIESKRDMMLEGGYVPGVDHAIPPDISWDNFFYYRERLHEIA